MEEEISFLEESDVQTTEQPESDEEVVSDAETDTDTDEEAATETEPQKYKVKHNKQEFELTLDELIQNASKGLDYDRIREDRDKLRTSPERKLIEQKAKEANMPVDKYIEVLTQAEQQQKIDARKQDLIDEGVNEKTADYIANLELKANGLETQVNSLSEQQQAETEAQAKMQKDIADFVQRFPGVTEFPKEVETAINAGENPTVAYLAYKNNLAAKELEALKQNTKNKELDPGSTKTEKETEQDEFLNGLFG